MPQRSHVHANLMSAPGLDFDFEKSEFAELRFDSLLNNILNDGLATTGAASRHANATNRIAADRAGDCAFVSFQPAVDEGDVCLVHSSSRKLGRQFAMGKVIFCDNNQ